MKMRNLSDFNDIYNIQDVIVLAVILEYCWQKIKDDTGFDPRCLMSVSTMSGAIKRIKSKADLMEKFLSVGYSSVHTRLGFDTEMFPPKSKKYMKKKDRILEDIKSVIDDPDEKLKTKKLNKQLYELFMKEDLNSTNKPIYSIRLDGESESHKRRVFSKTFKLDENNQYRFAMTKPLPIGIFK